MSLPNMDYALLANALSRIERAVGWHPPALPCFNRFRGVCMAQCLQCNAETELYDRGIPICPKCVDTAAGRSAVMQRVARELLKTGAGSDSAKDLA
jgi:hypothetical protein